MCEGPAFQNSLGGMETMEFPSVFEDFEGFSMDFLWVLRNLLNNRPFFVSSFSGFSKTNPLFLRSSHLINRFCASFLRFT